MKIERVALTVAEIAWAAGLFEGEGNVSIAKPRPHRATSRHLGQLRVSVTSTDLQVVAFFRERWGGRVRAVSDTDARHRQAYSWDVFTGDAVAFLEAMLPYFQRDVVKQRAVLAIAFQRQKTRLTSVSHSAEYRAAQVSYYDRLRALNKKGRSDAA